MSEICYEELPSLGPVHKRKEESLTHSMKKAFLAGNDRLASRYLDAIIRLRYRSETKTIEERMQEFSEKSIEREYGEGFLNRFKGVR